MPHPTTQFFTDRMPFLPPNQQRQSTGGTMVLIKSIVYSNKSVTDLPQMRQGNSSPDAAAGAAAGRCLGAGAFCLTVAGGGTVKLALVMCMGNSTGAVVMTANSAGCKQ